MAYSGSQKTRLGLIGITRGLYGSFAGKALKGIGKALGLYSEIDTSGQGVISLIDDTGQGLTSAISASMSVYSAIDSSGQGVTSLIDTTGQGVESLI